MKICFISKGGVTEFYKQENEQSDLLFFPFRTGEVSYEKELKGESNFFEEVAKISQQSKAVVISGCVTNAKGHIRKSAIVAENGRILGVSDMLHAIDGEVGCGANLRVYETKIGRVGVLVEKDLYFPETISVLTVCGADIIVCPFGKIGKIERILARAFSFVNGVPICVCANGNSFISSPSGELCFSTPLSPAYYTVCPSKEYHLTETRSCGLGSVNREEI